MLRTLGRRSPITTIAHIGTDLLFFVLAGIHGFIWIVLLGNLWYLRRTRTSARPAQQPSVSILIPARNEAANLQRLLPSLLRQRYPSFEVLVYNDGSTDATGAVLRSFSDDRLRTFAGDGPPPGWLGKPHALHQLQQAATGDVFLFLDADTELADPQALARLVAQYAAQPDGSVLTALPRLKGGALLLVSLLPSAMLTGLPWPLVRPLRLPSLGALNGQCWMIAAATYRALRPHRHVRAKVLEDVEIGRYLKREGFTPVLVDVTTEVSVFMYERLGDAWTGFRKNAYLILGGSPLAFVALWIFFAWTWVAGPALYPSLLLSVYGLKLITDRCNGLPWHVTVLAPLSYALGSVLQLHSALSHWTKRVTWKGRSVAS